MNNFQYICDIFKIYVFMRVIDYSLRLQCRPSRVHPDLCRVQIIIRLSSSGKRYSVTIPAVFKTAEVKKFDTLTHPLDTSDFNYDTWRKMRSWAWDVSSAMRDLTRHPERLNKSSIDARVKHYVEQRRQGKREWTIGDLFSDVRNAQEGVKK